MILRFHPQPPILRGAASTCLDQRVRPGRAGCGWLPLILIIGSLSTFATAQESFVPPEPFPVERYENGWRKNPFTLKTAPTAVQRESFSKNLALGSMYDDADGITSVVVVNTKTRERTRLNGKDAAPNGMRVDEAVIADTRRDSYAVVTLGAEKATLRYDEAFLKQMAAGGGGAANAQQTAAAGKKNGNNGAEPMQLGPNGEPVSNGNPAPPPHPHPNGAPGTTAMNSNGAPTPMPPGIRMPPTGMNGGRPTVPMRRRLTAPPSAAPQMTAPNPPAIPDNP